MPVPTPTTGEKEKESPPEIDEETEAGSPSEPVGTAKCSIPLGDYCKPINKAGRDDSGQNNLCETGWCQDISGVGGRCAKVGTFGDGKVQSSYEPHKDCVVSEAEFRERTGLDLCKWTKGFPTFFGDECSTAYTFYR